MQRKIYPRYLTYLHKLNLRRARFSFRDMQVTVTHPACVRTPWPVDEARQSPSQLDHVCSHHKSDDASCPGAGEKSPVRNRIATEKRGATWPRARPSGGFPTTHATTRPRIVLCVHGRTDTQIGSSSSYCGFIFSEKPLSPPRPRNNAESKSACCLSRWWW